MNNLINSLTISDLTFITSYTITIYKKVTCDVACDPVGALQS